MKTRFFCLFLSILLVISICCIFVSADCFNSIDGSPVNNYFDSELTFTYFNVDGGPIDQMYFVDNGNGKVSLNVSAPLPVLFTLRIASDNDCHITLAPTTSSTSLSLLDFDIKGGSFVDVTVSKNYVASSSVRSYFDFVSYESITYNDSVFNANWLISGIGNMYTFISANTYLVVLFFIGIALSLGFVAVKVIRRVMWGN